MTPTPTPLPDFKPLLVELCDEFRKAGKSDLVSATFEADAKLVILCDAILAALSRAARASRDDVLKLLDAEADVDDNRDGTAQVPNWAMRAATFIREALGLGAP